MPRKDATKTAAEETTVLSGAGDDATTATLETVLNAAIDEAPKPTIDDEQLAAPISFDNAANRIGDGTGDPEPWPNQTLPPASANGAEVFNPEIHESRDGKPVYNLDNTLRRKRGRKTGKQYAPGSTNGNGAATDPLATLGDSLPYSVQAKTEATATVDGIVAMGLAIGGEEWLPVCDRKNGVDERAQMIDAFARYYEATGATSALPVWAGPLVAVGAYALQRAQKPVTRSRLQMAGIFLWQKTPWGKRAA